MKKLFLTLILVAVSGVAAQAQFYFGGTLGFSYTHFRFSEDDKDGSASFKFLPEAGYSFNDRMGVGLTIGYARGYSAFGSFNPSELKDFISNVVAIGSDLMSSDFGNSSSLGAFRFAPYFRYSFYRIGKLELFLDAVLGLNFGNFKVWVGGEADKQQFTTFEIAARPGIAFAVSKNLKLVAKLGGIGYQFAGVNDTKQQISRFGLDADPSNLMFGIVYNLSHRTGKR